jgi:hypothetical protein
LIGTSVLAIPSAEASAAVPASVNAEPQVRIRVGEPQNRWRWRNRNRRVRVVTTTRITRVGRYRYRETIRTTYLPNGMTRTQVISRVRLVGRNW